MKTTAYGILTIIAAVASAIASYLKTGTFDIPATVTAITAGIGLLKAQDDLKLN